MDYVGVNDPNSATDIWSWGNETPNATYDSLTVFHGMVKDSRSGTNDRSTAGVSTPLVELAGSTSANATGSTSTR